MLNRAYDLECEYLGKPFASEALIAKINSARRIAAGITPSAPALGAGNQGDRRRAVDRRAAGAGATGSRCPTWENGPGVCVNSGSVTRSRRSSSARPTCSISRCVAEQCGFDTAAISDHFQPWRHTGGPRTRSRWRGWARPARPRNGIELGTSVLTPTFRYHPAVVAQAMGTLGSLFPGRIWLGVGTGESMNEAPLGIEWPDAQGTLRAAQGSRRADPDAADERASHLRRHVLPNPQRDHLRPSRDADPDLHRGCRRVGGTARRARRRRTHLHQRQGHGAVRGDAASGGGRGRTRRRTRPRWLELAIEMKVSFDSDPQRAREDTRHWAALALSPEEKTGVDDAVEMERLADALPTERAASRWIVSSDPDEHVERIRPYLDLGFTHLIFHAPGPDQRRFLELYAREVLPRLRDLAARVRRLSRP